MLFDECWSCVTGVDYFEMQGLLMNFGSNYSRFVLTAELQELGLTFVRAIDADHFQL